MQTDPDLTNPIERVKQIPILPTLLEVICQTTGIGFEPSQAERIFTAFHRQHGRAEYAGAGLGLAIVKRVVENHQGHIVAQSQPGQGTTFRVYLPI